MKRITVFMAFFAMLNGMAYGTLSDWAAYNDSVYQDGQFIAENVTTFAIGRGNPHPESGNLLKLNDGSDTGVTVTYSELKTVGSVNWATDNAAFAKGTDAAKIFSDVVDASGNISYGDAPGWHVDLAIEGLDSDGLYTFAGSVNRDGNGGDYGTRVTKWKIIGADSFTYASSDGAHRIAEDSVEFVTGINDGGYVAKWTNINSGSDGKIIIRTTHSIGKKNGGIADAHEYKGYAGGVFMLEFQGMRSINPKGKLTTIWSKIKFVR